MMEDLMASKPWKITHAGMVWTDADVEASQMIAVAELIGDTWDAVSPWTGPRSLAAWLAVLIAPVADGDPADKLNVAIRYVYAMKIPVLIACLSNPDEPAPVVAKPAAPSKRTTPKKKTPAKR